MLAILERLFEMCPAPKMIARGWGSIGFHKNIELAAADQAVVVGGVLTETEMQMAGAFRFHHFAGGVPNFRFDAAAADGADHGTVFTDQKFGALVAWNRPVHLHDGRHGTLLAEFPKPDYLVVEIHSSMIIARGGAFDDTLRGSILRFCRRAGIGTGTKSPLRTRAIGSLA